jgi:hypothetical protein
MKFAQASVLGFSLSLLASMAPSQASAAVQTVGAYNFNTSGQTLNTSAITIAPFTAGAPNTLTAVKLFFKSPKPTFGGQAGLNCGFGCTNTQFTANGTPTFNFSAGAGSLTTDNQGLVTLTPNQASTSTIATSSGTFNGNVVSGIATNNPTLKTYFSGTPTISSYQTLYSAITMPPGASIVWDGNASPFFGPTTLGGDFYIQYEYTSAVPGPLPILGAGAAFAYSRQIRKRIKQSV